MKHAILVVALLVSCGDIQPKTQESMLRARLASPGCKRACPLGQKIAPVEPQETHILDDCCYDLDGLTWSSCAWNSAGMSMALSEIMDPVRVSESGCGGPGWPDCPQQ